MAKPVARMGSLNGRCKGKSQSRRTHQPVVRPHPDFPTVDISVCSECGKVFRWMPAAR